MLCAPVVVADQSGTGSAGLVDVLRGSTLVVPALTLGNVPQLCVDLLIARGPSRLVARLHHADLLPFVGSSPAAPGGLALGAELWESSDRDGGGARVVILQQRAPAASSRRWYADLVRWAVGEARVSRLVLLASQEMKSPPPRVYDIVPGEENGGQCPQEVRDRCGALLSDELFGRHRTLVVTCPGEGDNASDAMSLASAVCFNLGMTAAPVPHTEWRVPATWTDQALWGNGPDQALF